ncbi:MAG: hypothetical protein COA78_06885 [Blastopirellula sp.]|nr:MAG: hypothetical protein COA78_06885 [Blastopirellula sp.]
MASTELMPFERETAIERYSKPDGMEPLVEKATALVATFEHDMTTAKGRAATKTLAANVGRYKVKLDECGKELTAEMKEKVGKVDANRKIMRDKLDLLKIEARRPLTEWEGEQEQLRLKKIEEEKAERLREKLESDHEMAILLDEKHDRDIADEAIETERARTEAQEAFEASEERKRLALIEEGAQKARMKSAESEAAEEDARRDEAGRADREREQEKLAQERGNLEQQAYLENSDRDKLAAELAAEVSKKALETAEAAAVEFAAEEQKEAARQERIATKKREENKAHTKKINNEALDAIKGDDAMTELGMTEELAKTIIVAIARGEIPNISIAY